jgi:predicted transposase YdaD
LLHIEPQSSWDGDFPERLFLYNALLRNRYGGPVITLALLLRREASAPNLTGLLLDSLPNGEEYLRFKYTVVRLWELPADQLLATGLGTTPLALLTDDAATRLPEVMNRFAERAIREAPNVDAGNLLLSCAFILLGLRYDEAVARALFQGVQRMRESTTYQGILREGRVEGCVEGERNALLLVLRTRFGSVPANVEARIRATADVTQLEAALVRAVQVAKPEELFS